MFCVTIIYDFNRSNRFGERRKNKKKKQKKSRITPFFIKFNRIPRSRLVYTGCICSTAKEAVHDFDEQKTNTRTTRKSKRLSEVFFCFFLYGKSSRKPFGIGISFETWKTLNPLYRAYAYVTLRMIENVDRFKCAYLLEFRRIRNLIWFPINLFDFST